MKVIDGRAMPKPSPAAVPTTETGRLDSLIVLQSFDGSFTLNEGLARVLGKSLKDLKIFNNNKYDDTVFGTALAVAYFKTKLAAYSEEWEFVVNKAEKWIATKLGSFPSTLIDEVTKYL